jgi:hypothetical protein
MSWSRAQVLARAWWERQGRAGVWVDPEGRRLNERQWSRYIAARWPEDWSERSEVKFSGTLAKLDLTRLPDAMVARIAGGEHPLAVLASAGAEVVEGEVVEDDEDGGEG